MIRFNSIFLTNFMSFKSTSFVYAQKGLILVEGENRDSMYADSNFSGKTNLMVEALLWCLFEQGLKEKGPDGNTMSQYRKDDVVLHGEDECSVAVEFSKDKSYYVIYRTKKRNGVSDLSVRIDGNVLRGKSKAHTQEILNSALGMSYTTASQVLMFGQGTRRFTQAKDSERKQVFEELLGLGVYGDALREVRGRKKELLDTIQVVEGNLQVADALVHQWQDWRDVAIQEYSDDDGKIKKWKRVILKKKTVLQEFVKHSRAGVQNSRDKIESLKIFIKKMEPRIVNEEDLEGKLDKVVKKMEPLDIEYRILEDRLESIVDEHVSNCPTCLHELDKGHMTKVVKDTEKRKKKILSLMGRLSTQIRSVEKPLGELRLLKREISKRKISLETEKEMFVYKKETAKDKVRQVKEVEALKPPQGEADHSKVDKAVEKYKEAKKKFNRLEKELKVLNKELGDLEFWEIGFGNKGIKSLMLDSILPVLNSEANKYIHHLMDDIEIEFDTETQTKGGEMRDQFDIRVRSGNSHGYHLASGGERRRIDFCIALALQSLLASTGSKSNIFILDEPFESVDESGIGELVDLLRDYSRKQGVAVYCITHLTNLKPLFDDVVTVTRENGVSRVA